VALRRWGIRNSDGDKHTEIFLVNENKVAEVSKSRECGMPHVDSVLRASCMPSIIFSISISGSLCFAFTAGSPCWNQHEGPYLHQPFREKNRHTSFPGVCIFLEEHILVGSVLGAHISPLIGIHLLDVGPILYKIKVRQMH
jgi:hypothetical protein